MAVLSQVSLAVIVRLSVAPAVGVVEAADRDRLAIAPGLTVTESPLPFEIAPSLTVMLALSTLYSVITPFEPLETDETPLVKVIVSTVPKLTPVPVFEVTVGCVPLGALDAPPNVRLLSPV